MNTITISKIILRGWILFFIFLIGGVNLSVAQTPEFSWLVQYGTTGKAAEVVNAVYAYDGNIYAVGFTFGDLGGSNQGGQDVFVQKYSSAGDVTTLQFGTAGNDVALALFVDASGVYVGGLTTGILPGQISQGGQDAFVLRLNHDLTAPPTWIKQFGSPNNESVEDIEGVGGAVYAVGQTNGPLTGQVNIGGIDAFLIKFFTNGTEDWRRQFGTNANDQGFGVAVIVIDNITEIYAVGHAGASLSGQVYNGGAGDIFVRRYDSSGTPSWTRLYGTSGFDQGFAACADVTGVYVTGADPIPNNTAYVRKLNFDNGDIIWHTPFGTPAAETGNEISCGGSAVTVAGLTAGSLFGVNAGGNDVFVASLEAMTGALTGPYTWGMQIGSPFNDNGNALTTDTSGIVPQVIVGGVATGLLPGSDTDGDIGGADGFLWTLDAATGTTNLLKQFGTLGPVDDNATTGASDGNNVYVAGAVGGPLPDQTHIGLADAYLRKFNPDNGAVLATTQFGSAAAETALVFVHSTGIYVAGSAQGLLPNMTYLGPGVVGPNDGYLTRFNSAGSFVEGIQFGTADAETVTGISVDDSGIYLVGSKGEGAASDISVWKFDFNLDQQFNVVFGSKDTLGNNRGDLGNGITAGAAGVYVVGQNIGGALPGQPPALGSDGFVRRLNPADGSEMWTRVVQTTGADNIINVRADATGVYVVGFVQGQLPGQPLLLGPQDAFVRKYDFNGNEIQIRMIQSSSVDNASYVSTDGLGVYVSGLTGGVLPGQATAGLADAYVVKYTTDLNELWSLQFGSAGVDNAIGISADDSGLFVAGSTTGTLPDQTSAGALDAYVGSLVLKIGIDIRPRTFPNDINLGAQGSLAAAILSSASFDASTVDPSTVTLEGANVKVKNNGKLMASLEDVNGDGLPDLVVHFSIADLQLTSDEAVLKGQTSTGDHIRGVDTVQVVP